MPFRIHEWMVACAAAVVSVCIGWIDISGAARAVVRGADVYAFLFGIVAIAELLRYAGIFDWIAAWLLRIASGSFALLFASVYALGTLVTILLSNDTTAVILAPAVFAAVARVRGTPRPYLYACAFVANAASFVLPISNPANLVVFGSRLPPLVPWLCIFALPSLAAILLTFAVLALRFRRGIGGTYEPVRAPGPLDHRARAAGLAALASATALIVSATLGWRIGATALSAAALSTAFVGLIDRAAYAAVLRHLAWDIVFLVAGLFVVVSALDRHGVLELVRAGVIHATSLGPVIGSLGVGAAVTVASTFVNNLPVGLVAGTALAAPPAAPWITHATMVAVDLGPNLAATSSLATMLWLAALRRDGVSVSWLEFLGVGSVVVVPALVVALLLLR